jgi:dihydrofolate reductase
MRRVIFQMMLSLDGFYEGPHQEIDWHVVDAEYNDYAIDLLNDVEALIFGRVTYRLMANYWPTAEALKDDQVVAERMNSLPKFVFSKTLEKAEWSNTILVKGNTADELLKIKQEPGKDMVIFGSSDLAVTLAQHGLIDEFRLIYAPILLGHGKTVFTGIENRLFLKLFRIKTLQSGVVILYYTPA